MADELGDEVRSDIAVAIELMKQALVLLDRHSQFMAAISVSTAIEQAGGNAPEPGPQDRLFGCFG